jgi:hypothetical protein
MGGIIVVLSVRSCPYGCEPCSRYDYVNAPCRKYKFNREIVVTYLKLRLDVEKNGG